MIAVKKQRGFTLIELLVVIAIIGILSSVVLASLNVARDKADDANIKQNLSNIRAQGSIAFDSADNYNVICGANGTPQDPIVVSQLASAGFASGTTTSAICGGSAITGEDAAAYAVASPLKTGGAWCVDNTGVARSVDVNGNAYADVSAALDDNMDTSCN